MAFIPTSNTAKVVIEAVATSVEIVNTLWFTKGSDYTEADLDDLLVGVATWIDTHFRPTMSNQWSVTQMIAYDMANFNGPVVTITPILTGILTGAVDAYQDVTTITFKTANRGRSGRGSNRISPLRNADLTDNVVLATLRDNLVLAYSNLNSTVQASSPGSAHVVVSFQENNVPRLVGLAQYVTAYVSTTGYVRTQKSRREPGSN